MQPLFRTPDHAKAHADLIANQDFVGEMHMIFHIENADAPLTAGGIPIRLARADWIRFEMPAGVKAAS